MVFSSLTFIYFFLPVVLIAYYIAPKKAKNMVLLISGIWFYAWGEPIYIFVMLLSATIDYVAGLLLHKYDRNPKIRFLCLIVSLCMNLGLLGIFKYSSLFIGTMNDLFGLSLTDPELPLPIGISFYTFQSMSYTIDMYMRNIKVQKNPVSFLCYVTLFPQIVAGPIVRYEDVANELDQRTVTVSGIGEGVGMFARGLGKKILLANNIGLLWTTIKAMPADSLPVLTAWLGILAFTFQIYFDFSGYSDMAVGMGKMLGFNFPENFRFPYMSRSISEFWRRWHITLGTWFRLYVYIPLGGNRKGAARTVLNLLIVWTLTGFWHGASWNFLLWGLYFGVIIVIERLFLGKILEKLPAPVSMLYSFLLVVFGWVLFEFDQLPNAFAYLGAMFGTPRNGFLNPESLSFLSNYWFLFVVCIIGSTNFPKRIANRLLAKFPRLLGYAPPVYELLLILLSTAYLVNATYNPFLYFRF